MMMTFAASAVVARPDMLALGEVAIDFLILAIVLREVFSSSKFGQALSLNRGLTIIIVPLSLAVAVVLFQQIIIWFR